MPVKTKNLPTVYVVGGGLPYIRLFYELGYQGAKHAGEASIVVFTGGADIDPQLYGERPLRVTHWDAERDKRDLEAYAAVAQLGEDGPPTIGICRGAQFLNVMNGGKLWQDVTDHRGIHTINDLSYNTQVEVTSTHHQMMIPSAGGLVLAATNISQEKLAFGRDEFRHHLKNPEEMNDIEVVWYDETRCLCFQPHPEIGHQPTKDYFARLVDDFVFPVI